MLNKSSTVLSHQSNMPLVRFAKSELIKEHRTYHNIDHIKRCFEWSLLHAEMSVPLFLAIWFHDVIYDAKPDKELRSIIILKSEAIKSDQKISTNDLNEAIEYIRSTIDHRIKGVIGPRPADMIRVDLADLSVPERVIENYSKIMKESMSIYNIDSLTFAKNNMSFMLNLQQTCEENMEFDEPSYRDFWANVLDGIKLTMDLSHEIIRYYDK